MTYAIVNISNHFFIAVIELKIIIISNNCTTNLINNVLYYNFGDSDLLKIDFGQALLVISYHISVFFAGQWYL